jgi:hypothetical protein
MLRPAFSVMRLVTVYRALNPADAQLVRSRLDAAGFLAVVTHEGSSLWMEGYALATGGILVQVPDDQSTDARALLDAPAAESDVSGNDDAAE